MMKYSTSNKHTFEVKKGKTIYSLVKKVSLSLLRDRLDEEGMEVIQEK